MNPKLKIYDPSTDMSKEDAKQLYLKLILDEENDILMCCVDKSGNKIDRGNILFIDLKLDIIVTMRDINNNIPLKTDLVNEPLIYSIRELEALKSEEEQMFISQNIINMIRRSIETQQQQEELLEQHKH